MIRHIVGRKLCHPLRIEFFWLAAYDCVFNGEVDVQSKNDVTFVQFFLVPGNTDITTANDKRTSLGQKLEQIQNLVTRGIAELNFGGGNFRRHPVDTREAIERLAPIEPRRDLTSYPSWIDGLDMQMV
ncbi:hypothetical protein KR96_11940 [Ralstonia solanacearum]|nr:hypothetical protein KR96_11940 [Ralstonia solanacearum]